jgi:hypothetical protein
MFMTVPIYGISNRDHRHAAIGQGGLSKSSMTNIGLIESGHYAPFAGIFNSVFFWLLPAIRVEDSLLGPHLLQQLLDPIHGKLVAYVGA